LEHYSNAKEEQKRKGGPLSDYFGLKAATPKEKAVYGYLKFLVMKSLPVSYVEDPMVREFSKFGEHPVSRDTLTRTIIQLVELVEGKITKEMEDSPHGGLLHDGWTCNGTHYVGVFGTYIIQYKKYHSKKDVEIVEEPVITLLACAPLGNQDDLCDSDEIEVQEATQFNAENHVHFFEQTLQFYRKECGWVPCSMADNCSVNQKIAKLLGVPHVGCQNHKLNLEVKYMIAEWPILKTLIEKVNECQKSVKTKLKNAAILRNMTDLRPVLIHEICWSSIRESMCHWVRLHETLMEAADHEDATIEMD
jgi:hypothetical protein